MNYYVVVEGSVEKLVFEKWIPFVNDKLAYVDHPSKLVDDNFTIVSGLGYPNYLGIISSAIEDIAATGNTARLVTCVDSEDFTRAEKYAEIQTYILANGFNGLDFHIVIQHFCFETWVLGNRRVGPRRPSNPELIQYKRYYDVLVEDPEGLPAMNDWNRAQFAEIYLRRMLQDKHRNASYSKNRPDLVAHNTYFVEVCGRVDDTGHNDSFKQFLDAFQ